LILLDFDKREKAHRSTWLPLLPSEHVILTKPLYGFWNYFRYCTPLRE